MLSTIWTFIRSFYSPDLYDEVSNANRNSGFSYLFNLSFAWSIIILIITIISSIFLSGVALYIAKFPLPAINFLTGSAAVILMLFLKIIIPLILAVINALIFAIIISVISCFAALPGKIFSVILMAKLEYSGIRQIAIYSYAPSAIVFAGVFIWLGIYKKIGLFALIKPFHNFLTPYLIDMPSFISGIIFMLGFFLMPLPVWVIYIFYGVLSSKLSFLRMQKAPSKR